MNNPQLAPEAEAATKLLPCPHCGEQEHLYPAYRGFGEGKPYAIDCIGCGADFTPREGIDVIAAWNRRAPGSTGAVAPEPAAWRVKDFADGWILVHTEMQAKREADGAGNLIEPLYTHPAPADTGQGGRVETALRQLANETAGLAAFEHAVREAIGNTNYSVLMQRVVEARAALDAGART